MEKERLKRYKEKIELVEKRISNIEETLQTFEKETSKLACYKAFQEVVEIITDIIAMILIDKNKVVNDDYANIEKINEIILFSKEEISILNEANGLRNRVIHEYNKTNDKTAKESINKLLPELVKIINKFEKFIEEDAK